jgi:hypothetical protein
VAKSTIAKIEEATDIHVAEYLVLTGLPIICA